MQLWFQRIDPDALVSNPDRTDAAQGSGAGSPGGGAAVVADGYMPMVLEDSLPISAPAPPVPPTTDGDADTGGGDPAPSPATGSGTSPSAMPVN